MFNLAGVIGMPTQATYFGTGSVIILQGVILYGLYLAFCVQSARLLAMLWSGIWNLPD